MVSLRKGNLVTQAIVAPELSVDRIAVSEYAVGDQQR